jgi:hypothetical protein
MSTPIFATVKIGVYRSIPGMLSKSFRADIYRRRHYLYVDLPVYPGNVHGRGRDYSLLYGRID